MPYVIFRDMGPHFDSYANSGIPDIIGTNLELYCCESEQTKMPTPLPSATFAAPRCGHGYGA